MRSSAVLSSRVSSILIKDDEREQITSQTKIICMKPEWVNHLWKWQWQRRTKAIMPLLLRPDWVRKNHINWQHVTPWSLRKSAVCSKVNHAEEKLETLHESDSLAKKNRTQHLLCSRIGVFISHCSDMQWRTWRSRRRRDRMEAPGPCMWFFNYIREQISESSYGWFMSFQCENIKRFEITMRYYLITLRWLRRLTKSIYWSLKTMGNAVWLRIDVFSKKSWRAFQDQVQVLPVLLHRDITV